MKNTIKNITRTIVLGGGMLLAVGVSAATTASFTPSTVNTAPGRTFTVTVNVNANGVQNFAEELDLNFPANLLEVRSFVFASDWIQLTQSDYDVVDNVRGVLVKSAGLPGGFSGLKTYGTITFFVKQAGSGNVTLGTDSVAFDANGEVPMTGGGITVNSTASAPAPTPTPTVTNTNTNATVSIASTTPTIDEDATSTPEIFSSSTSGQLAQVGSSGFSLNWLWVILGLLVLGGVTYYFVRK